MEISQKSVKILPTPTSQQENLEVPATSPNMDPSFNLPKTDENYSKRNLQSTDEPDRQPSLGLPNTDERSNLGESYSKKNRQDDEPSSSLPKTEEHANLDEKKTQQFAVTADSDSSLKLPNTDEHRETVADSVDDQDQDPSSLAGADDVKRVTVQKSILESHGIIMGKVIGSGNYAKVKIAYSEELSRRVAVKIISKLKAPPDYTNKFLPREIDAVKGLRHENLINFYQCIETNHRVYIVMQLAENGTLLEFVREKNYLEEPFARRLFRQLVNAVGYIHSKGVVHRDIKCENLLLDVNYNLKLIDFGFARKDVRDNERQVILSKTFCGSYAYASPEILKGIAYDPVMSDVWATGVVCYAMVYGRLPYNGSNVNVLLKKINSSLVFRKSPLVSTGCKHLLLHILAPLRMRYTIQQIKDDSWFSLV